MLRTAFHDALRNTFSDCVAMAKNTVTALRQATAALENGDSNEGARALLSEEVVEGEHRTIEAACLELLWKQTPVANEFREVAGLLEISGEFEAIVHHAAEVAKRAVVVTERSVIVPQVRELAKLANAALDGAVRALIEASPEGAQAAYEAFEHSEDAYEDSITALQDYLQAHPDHTRDATSVLFAIGAMRRICKRSNNVADDVLEMIGDGAEPQTAS